MEAEKTTFDYSLLTKYITEELSHQELEAVTQWKNISDQNERIYQHVFKLRIQHKYNYYNDPEKVKSALNLINEKINHKSLGYLLKTFTKYAAIITILFLATIFTLIYNQKESYITIIVKNSEGVKKHSLEDGTIVWLNEASVLRIPKSFSPENRQVEVTGEAYFDVKKNQSVPFIVHMEKLDIRAVGTSFNVKSSDDGMIEAILTSGKVLLQDKKQRTMLEMSPGEKVTYIPEREEYHIEEIDVNVSTAWHLDQLTFDCVTLREIVNKISVLYDVNVNLESKLLADKKFRCVINRDESLTEVLDILKFLAQIQYRIEGDEVFISE